MFKRVIYKLLRGYSGMRAGVINYVLHSIALLGLKTKGTWNEKIRAKVEKQADSNLPVFSLYKTCKFFF